MKWRNSKERELLACGGSREQTLPNKNNPNPDLSDANVNVDKTITNTTSTSELHRSDNSNLRNKKQTINY